MAVTVIPLGDRQYLDDDGNPLSAGTVTFYAAGTTTPIVLYHGFGLDPMAVYTNPITLDAAGRVPSPHTVYVAATSAIKYLVKDSNGVTILTVDNLPPAAAAS